MFVESTPDAELINLLRNIEETHKIDEKRRIKFIEKSGSKLINRIGISDPFRSNCEEQDCLCCQNNNTKFTNCRKNNVGYSIQCKTCKQESNKKITYEGETARNMYNRSKEHVRLVKNKNENSPLYKHMKTVHEGNENVQFEMRLTGIFNTPLARITNEGVRIKNTKESELMNSKKEFFGPSVRRK